MYDNKTIKKALAYILDNDPHAIDSIEKLYNDKTNKSEVAKISFENILSSKEWDAKEKVKLIKIFGYDNNEYLNKYKAVITELRDYYGSRNKATSLIDYYIVEDLNYSAVEALLKLDVPISIYTISEIMTYVSDENVQHNFIKLIINKFNEKKQIKMRGVNGDTIVNSLSMFYPLHIESERRTKLLNPLELVFTTNNLFLMEDVLSILDKQSINHLFEYAVRSGNKEIVKMFLARGADVNYRNEEHLKVNHMPLRRWIRNDISDNYDELRHIFIQPKPNHIRLSNLALTNFMNLSFKEPLKVAIDNNDYEMVKLLVEAGINLEKQEPNHNNSLTDEDEMSYYYSPLQYLIHMGIGSIKKKYDFDYNGYALLNTYWHENKKEIKIKILRYLKDHGAIADLEHHYTKLLDFAVEVESFDLIEELIEENENSCCPEDICYTEVFKHMMNKIENDGYFNGAKQRKYLDILNLFVNNIEEYTEEEKKILFNSFIELCYKIGTVTIDNGFKEEIKELLTKITKELPEDIIKSTPIFFALPESLFKDAVNLGYDINSEKGNHGTILFDSVKNAYYDAKDIEFLVGLGADLNHIDANGKSALQHGIEALPKYSRSMKIEYYQHQFDKCNYLINNTCVFITTCENMKETLEKELFSDKGTCYIYIPIIKNLGKMGLKISNDNFKMLEEVILEKEPFHGETYYDEDNEISEIYAIFDNSVKQGVVMKQPYFKYIGNNICVLKEHIKRNFVTTEEELKNIEDKKQAYDDLHRQLIECASYVETKDMLDLIDSIPIANINYSIPGFNYTFTLLLTAMEKNDIDLIEGLIQRGATVECYNEQGDEITFSRYTEEQINIFNTLGGNYNKNNDDSLDELLAEIGIKKMVKTKSTSEINNN